MARDRRHFILNGLGRSKSFKARGGGSAKHPTDVPDRAAHAQALLHVLDHLPDPHAENRPGIYLDIEGRPGEIMVTKSLNSSGLNLLSVRPPDQAANLPGAATVFATPEGLDKLRKKIEAFENKNSKSGRPSNADLVQSISVIVEASLRAFWRSPQNRFPPAGTVTAWEIWLKKDEANAFIEQAGAMNVVFSQDRLEFPEDIVVLGHATQDALAMAIKSLGTVTALAAPTATTAFFDGLPVEEQLNWMASLQALATYLPGDDPNYLTLLDTGVSRAHPLISPALSGDDRHAARPEWGVEDVQGHGTQLAGLALFGDLTNALQTIVPFEINYRLESVKIVPDAGDNPYELLGAVTRHAIDAVEAVGNRRRTFSMASTTEDDTPHDGAPTSWSSALDQLAAGEAGNQTNRRLFVVSAGNSVQANFGNDDYLSVCDHADNELESPAHAWNVIAVGAYTTKTVLPAGVAGAALAPAGDLSPSSRTASWSSHWPIKPDVVFEGGNWLAAGLPPPLRHEALSLLTTDASYPLRAFTLTYDTSAATALAAKGLTQLWSDYPDLWPETVRALFVGSARWTAQMRSHLPPAPAKPAKGTYTALFQRYGYGVPDLDRARRSASNAFTLIVQDEITPYKPGEKGAPNHAHNEMRLFTLPWPIEALRVLGAHPVKLRVALSSFIIPNPAEAARGSKFGYASHNLRFKLNRPNEKEAAFLARISLAADTSPEVPVDEDDGWDFGSNRRDVGSLHIDELTCPASDLARRNLLAVHPVTGWWKAKATAKPEERSTRFALIVEIDAGDVGTDLYTEVQTAIDNLNVVAIAV